jgi:hypothetical protein
MISAGPSRRDRLAEDVATIITVDLRDSDQWMCLSRTVSRDMRMPLSHRHCHGLVDPIGILRV